MSPEFLAAVAALNPRPKGHRSAISALVEWCSATGGDKRLRYIAEADGDEAGGAIIGRALRAGGWDGSGMHDLAADMASGCASIISAVDLQRSGKRGPA